MRGYGGKPVGCFESWWKLSGFCGQLMREEVEKEKQEEHSRLLASASLTHMAFGKTEGQSICAGPVRFVG